jgi:hypothetical protein
MNGETETLGCSRGMSSLTIDRAAVRTTLPWSQDVSIFDKRSWFCCYLSVAVRHLRRHLVAIEPGKMSNFGGDKYSP